MFVSFQATECYLNNIIPADEVCWSEQAAVELERIVSKKVRKRMLFLAFALTFSAWLLQFAFGDCVKRD